MWNTICALLFFTQLLWCWGNNYYFESAKVSEFWMSHKVEVDHLDRGPRRAAGLLPVIFSVIVWFLSGRLFMLQSPASRGRPWGHAHQSELSFPVEDPAALYISGQILCSLDEGLNFIIRMTASPLCCDSAGMSAFTPFCQQPNYSFLPLGSCPSFSITPTLSWLWADRSSPIFHPVALTYKSRPSGVPGLLKMQYKACRTEVFGTQQSWFWIRDQPLTLWSTLGELPNALNLSFLIFKRRTVLSTL